MICVVDVFFLLFWEERKVRLGLGVGCYCQAVEFSFFNLCSFPFLLFCRLLCSSSGQTV
jgi:hypothetical protein